MILRCRFVTACFNAAWLMDCLLVHSCHAEKHVPRPNCSKPPNRTTKSLSRSIVSSCACTCPRTRLRCSARSDSWARASLLASTCCFQRAKPSLAINVLSRLITLAARTIFTQYHRHSRMASVIFL